MFHRDVAILRPDAELVRNLGGDIAREVGERETAVDGIRGQVIVLVGIGETSGSEAVDLYGPPGEAEIEGSVQ